MPLIQPSTARFIKKASSASIRTAGMAYYKAKTGYTLQPKRGRTSQKDPVAVALNKYAKHNIGNSAVAYIYSKGSRVIRGTENLLAVKLSGGAKGWITPEGRFISEEGLRNALKGLDSTAIGSGESPLLALYDSLSPAQKAKVADALRDFDWDEFWKEMYPAQGRTTVDRQFDLYDEVVDIIGTALGR